MRKLLSYLSLAGKVAVPVASLFGVHISGPLLTLAFASIVKHLADEFYDYEEKANPTASTPASAVKPLSVLAFACVPALMLCGCLGTAATSPSSTAQPAATSAASISTSLSNYAYTVANVLQTQNNGQTLQTGLVKSGLALAGASPKTQQQAAIVNQLTSLVGDAIIAAHDANVPAPVTQSVVNGALAPAAVQTIATQAAAPAAPPPPPATAPTTLEEIPPFAPLWTPKPSFASVATDLRTSSF